MGGGGALADLYKSLDGNQNKRAEPLKAKEGVIRIHDVDHLRARWVLLGLSEGTRGHGALGGHGCPTASEA